MAGELDVQHAGPLLQIGQKLGNYQVVRQLGQGGMGAVFEAVHQYIGRQAAIKVLHPDLSQNAQFATRFLNEARAVNLIKHPGLVEIFEFGILDSGTAYIVMELLEGRSLAEVIGRGEVGDDALAIARQIAQAMAAAHDKGIVHRDLKPDNVMLVPDRERPGQWRVKVLDFGIAKVSGPIEGKAHTETGTAMGTPAYMAPEQCVGASTVDGKVDVYALGIILYEMLSGALPFEADHSFDYMAAHVRQAPRPLRALVPEVPEEVAALVHRMLAKEPAARPAMAEAVAQLEALHPSMPSLPAIRGASRPLPEVRRSTSEAFAATVQAATTPAPGTATTRTRRPWLAAGLAAGLLLAAGAAWRLRPTPAPRTTPAAATAAAAPARAAAPRTVRWEVASVPLGAELLREDGTLLGRTPFVQERPAAEGKTVLRLRHPGHEDLTFAISNGADFRGELPLARAEPKAPAPAPAPPARHASSKGKKTRPRPAEKQRPDGDVPLLD